MTQIPVKTLFVDIGGVLLTNGWDDEARISAATIFDLARLSLLEPKMDELSFGGG